MRPDKCAQKPTNAPQNNRQMHSDSCTPISISKNYFCCTYINIKELLQFVLYMQERGCVYLEVRYEQLRRTRGTKSSHCTFIFWCTSGFRTLMLASKGRGCWGELVSEWNEAWAQFLIIAQTDQSMLWDFQFCERSWPVKVSKAVVLDWFFLINKH